MQSLLNSNIANCLIKDNGGGGGETEDLSSYFCSLKCFNYWWVSSGGMEQKVLFRAG